MAARGDREDTFISQVAEDMEEDRGQQMELNVTLQELISMSTGNQNKPYRKFDALRRRRNYYHEKFMLGNQFNISENNLVAHLIDRFDNSMLQYQAKMSRFTNLEDLLDVTDGLTNFERNVLRPSLSGHTSTVVRRPVATSVVERREMICFACSKEGHIASRCPQKKCLGCNETRQHYDGCLGAYTCQVTVYIGYSERKIIN
ncbi:hypothetical protein FQR65_LT14080 [Abscondita terminalis]|nr:hypothetical protein FQR65_LT14080 [Abscondita terminalis]